MRKKDEIIANLKLLEKALALVKTEIGDVEPEKAEAFLDEQDDFYRKLKAKHLRENIKSYDITDAMADVYYALGRANC